MQTIKNFFGSFLGPTNIAAAINANVGQKEYGNYYSTINNNPSTLPGVAVNMNAIEKFNDSGIYIEEQENYLCAKHAINHILQEEKTVWVRDAPLYLEKGTVKASNHKNEAMDTNTQINLFNFCTGPMYQMQAAQIGIFPKNANPVPGVPSNYEQYVINSMADPERVCNLKPGGTEGMIPFDSIGILMGQLLNYDMEPIYFYGVDVDKKINDLKKMLMDDRVLGCIFNLGQNHFTAISKFANNCKTWERNATKRLRSVNYVYLDSIGKKTKCSNFDKIIAEFNIKTRVTSVIVIKSRKGSYKSVTNNRLEAIINTTNGGRRRTSRNKSTVGTTRKRRF